MIVPEKRDPKEANFILKVLYQRIGAKIEIVTFSDVFFFSWPRKMETFVHWLCITEFILNNAHHTQTDRLAAPIQSNG